MENPVPTITIDEPFGSDFAEGGHDGYYLEQGDFFFLPMKEGDGTTSLRSWTPIAFQDGFTSDFSMRKHDQVTQELNLDFNALGFYMTLGTYMRQCGSFPTFNVNVCNAIGGYPKGTILRCYMNAIGRIVANPTRATYMMDVVSLQDNNTKNFLYASETNREPYVIGSEVDGVEKKDGTYASSLGYVACMAKTSVSDSFTDNGKRRTDELCPLSQYTAGSVKMCFSGKPYQIPKGVELVFYPQRRVEVVK